MASTNETDEKKVHAQSIMESYVKDWKIFIDTCSVLHPSAQQFWINIIPYLRTYQNKIFFPLRCVEELQKHAERNDNPDLSERAKSALKTVEQLIRAGFIEVRGESSDNFADNVFHVVFSKFRVQHKMLLITQDKKLAADILKFNDSGSVYGKPINVRQINQYGFLSSIIASPKPADQSQTQPQRNSSQHHAQPSAKANTTAVDDREVFRICKTVTTFDDTPLNVSYIPGENEMVYSSAGAVKLGSKINAGGEGIIYDTATPYVAKIYYKEKITRRKFEKIKLMLSKRVDYEGICYPVAVLYNHNREFIGFLMPRAKGKELQKGLFIKPLFQKKFPNWNKKDTVELCITILKKIKHLHDRNIIMGDINPANILVVSPQEVYFVDTDSYQIEDFPCPVGTINYTAPEIQRKHFAHFLRTIGNENFAVATLLFMIMLPGKPPYSQQGGEDPISNIERMDFSYPFGESSNKRTPDGPWRFIWSHMTYDMKGAFYNTFRKGGAHSTENTRLSVDEWLSNFTYYHDLLASGKLSNQDSMAMEIYPTRHKKNPNVSYITCKLCGKEVPEAKSQNGICGDCLKDGETYRCQNCGKEMLFTNYQKYIKNNKPFELCPDCFEHGKQVKERRTCTSCGSMFEITNSQYQFFVDKGYELPRHCKKCRDAHKNGAYPGGSNHAGSSYGGYNSGAGSYPSNPGSRSSGTGSYPSNPGSRPSGTGGSNNSSGSGGSFCFISTAVCDYLGKSDDCCELTALRGFRDNWLRYQPDGQELIAEYYNCAPLVVSKLKASPYHDGYCQYLWDEYLKPCLELIRNCQYQQCKEKYIEMYNYVQSLF